MLPPGRIKTTPEDFIVEEIPLYEPSGTGDHLYIRFTKRNLTTDAAVRVIAGALGAQARDVGVAGMKDKVAVTTQTISVQIPRGAVDAEARALGLAIDGITVHEARRHGNKLRTGHLAGNRFDLRVRGIPHDRVAEVTASLQRLAEVGVPNAFGVQRFGRDGDNAEQARAWLTGKAPAPRDPRLRRLLFSSLQSAIFNEVLRRRVDDGTWATPLEGDLLKRHESGGLFVCADVQADRPRAEAGEVSPTGPIFGAKMREPEGAPLALEREVVAQIAGIDIDWNAVRNLGEGTRRALRLWVADLHVTADEVAPDEPNAAREHGSSIRVQFVLPKGAYATTVLDAAVDLHETGDTAPASASPDVPGPLA